MKASAGEQLAGLELASPRRDDDPSVALGDPGHSMLQDDLAARHPDVLGIGRRDLTVIDDSGPGHPERAHAGAARFDLPQRLAIDELDAFDAVGQAALMERFEPRQLLVANGDDHLPAPLRGNPFFGAVPVHRRRPRDRQPRLQRAGRVVDAGMDHARVVAGLMARGTGLLLEDAQAEPRMTQKQLAGSAKPDDPGADDDDVEHRQDDAVCPIPSRSTASSTRRRALFTSGRGGRWPAAPPVPRLSS